MSMTAEDEPQHWEGQHPLQRMIHGSFGGETPQMGDGSISGLDVRPCIAMCFLLCVSCRACLAAGPHEGQPRQPARSRYVKLREC